MNQKLLKPYDPKATEDRIYKAWEKSGYFNPDKLPKSYKLKAKSFCVTIPPPNITGSLHLGHALNATIQDILIRYKRMNGYKTLWLPGIDHAGIATQNVVERELKKQGITRHNLGREKFLEKVWEWKEKYGHIILDQFKKIGASCDWSRTRFTMDKDYMKAVETAFLHYYKKGWIYQGNRIVNWCPRCQTSLSDLETIDVEQKDKFYYLKYGPFVIATARPETKFGDKYIVVHPDDKRYKNFEHGQKIKLEWINGPVTATVIKDKVIDMDFGTGAMTITPWHDMVDFDLAEKYNLEKEQIIDFNGRLLPIAGEFKGMKISEARPLIVEKLKTKGLLVKTDEDYKHTVKTCYRCDSLIEPQISKQWFLKMTELAETAKRAVKRKKIKFHPKKWEKVYFDWLNNIKDWCISRQLWWGHKIPLDNVDDVLDTWFSSALWPFATLGWPEKTADLKTFYPTQVLSTARDIINLWVTRMIFSGYEFLKERPFEEVIIHPTILTHEGKRMSKSLGTGIDPLTLIEKYGADATRFGLIYQTMGGQDIHFTEDHVLAGKKFCNKIWNATRFVLAKSGNLKPTKADKEILKKIKQITKSVEKNIKEYKFGPALRLIYDFFWHDFCDKYIEASKSEGGGALLPTLTTSLKLLHPFMPFITEEIWSLLPIDLRCRFHRHRKSMLIIEKWPKT